MPSLSGPIRPPRSGGTADSLVVMLHGIGADGEDLITLADLMGDIFPNTAFHAPNAPQRFAEAPFGYQWFPRAQLTENTNTKRVEQTVNAFIDELLDAYNLDSSRCLLMGFSQGSIVAMHVAPRRSTALAGVVAFSGAMPSGPTLRSEMLSQPPFLLVHGADDGVLPSQESEKAARALEAAGIPVSVHVLPSLGHSIDQRGLELAVEFMKEALAVA